MKFFKEKKKEKDATIMCIGNDGKITKTNPKLNFNLLICYWDRPFVF